ncbi:zinc ribbon-containing protein [Halalkalibacterium halodurans]|uniref:zinc ribbon-containing protein n=1 Tax=Halalkalibacterium halodurans TaxID=86665 RepID=UPI0009FB28B4
MKDFCTIISNFLLGKEVSLLPKTGEKPGIGRYSCTDCFTKVNLDDRTDTLPPCPKCHGTSFRKLY